MKLHCYKENAKEVIPVFIINESEMDRWLGQQTAELKNWLMATQFKYEPGSLRIVPNQSGNLACVICCNDPNNLWSVGSLPLTLPEGVYQLQVVEEHQLHLALAWGLGSYQFTRYKKPLREAAQLLLSKEVDKKHLHHLVESIYFIRDLINTPADDMGPSQLAVAMEKLSHQFTAEFKQIVGEELLDENYSAIYTVGRASDDAPRLLDMRWGKPTQPKVTLVGKGVCFDSGGLDLKSSPHMLLMKKDMAGAAHVLGLARMIMAAKLPICLRVLIPAVENVVSGNAYRPGDIVKSRKGLTIEIGNTDAEGRVVLADALTEAVSEQPDLVIDISTLTGAARVALGTELPAVFCNQDDVMQELLNHAQIQNDPMWRMPFFTAYREHLNSSIADINNNSSEPYGGAITAALFLKEFMPDEIPWVHFDMMAWNLRTKPGRPQGGEAMAVRALFAYLAARFQR